MDWIAGLVLIGLIVYLMRQLSPRRAARTESPPPPSVTVSPPRPRGHHDARLADVELPDGRSLNHETVRTGHAWRYSKYSKDSDLAAVERDARRSRRGLWQDDDAEAPWQYRKHRRR